MTDIMYAVGDIHGDLEQLHRIMAWIDADMERSDLSDQKVIFIGDLVDRRPASREVIDYLLDGIEAGKNWIVLKGNHDRLMTNFLKDPLIEDAHLKPGYSWLHHRIGGVETLASYGVEAEEGYDLFDLHRRAISAIPPHHVKFLSELPTSHDTPDYFFAHAGINPDVPLAEQTEDDLVWIRKPFFAHHEPFEKFVIHGHTVIDAVTRYPNRLNIDTGAAWGDTLSAIVCADGEIWQLSETGRLPIQTADHLTE